MNKLHTLETTLHIIYYFKGVESIELCDKTIIVTTDAEQIVSFL